MTAWPKLLSVTLLLMVSACVSAGARAITDPDVVSRIEVGKSTQAEVEALLGCPISASYGDQGEETWHYTYITTAPRPTEFIPLVKAIAPSLRETRRDLAVTFDAQGAVTDLGWAPTPKRPSPTG